MKILIDAHMLGTGEGGNERYVSNLARHISTMLETGLLLTVKQKKLGKVKQIICSKSNLKRYLWEIPTNFWKYNYDVVVTTYFVSPLVARHNVIIVHDMLPFRHPEFFNVRERLQFLFMGWSLKKSLGILVPTEFVKREITHYYPRLKSKIFITSEASDPIFYNMTSAARKVISHKYRKNVPAILIMGSRFAKRPIKPVLDSLMFFKRDIKVYLIQPPRSFREDDYPELNIVVLKNLSDQKLCEYFNLADCLIYPTIYEGFGLPVIEAMKIKLPIITTMISPIKELAGSAAYYADFGDNMSWQRELGKVLSDKESRIIKVNCGYNRASKYSWDKTAARAVQAFQILMEKL